MRFLIRPSTIIATGIIVLLLTAIFFYFSVDQTKYSVCLKYSCIEFFSNNFSTVIKVIAAEAGFFSFLVAMATLSATAESVALSAESNGIAKRTVQYEMFVRVVNIEISRFDELSGLTVNEPVLFKELLAATRRPTKTSFGAIKRRIEASNSAFSDFYNWDPAEHQDSMTNALDLVGLTVPETDIDTYFKIESTCITFLERLTETFSLILGEDREITVIFPDRLYPPAHTV